MRTFECSVAIQINAVPVDATVMPDAPNIDFAARTQSKVGNDRPGLVLMARYKITTAARAKKCFTVLVSVFSAYRTERGYQILVDQQSSASCMAVASLHKSGIRTAEDCVHIPNFSSSKKPIQCCS